MRGFLRRLLLILLSFCLLPPIPLAADRRDDARTAERAGDSREAVALYLQWLDENLAHIDSTDVLLHTVSLLENASEALTVMQDYAERLSPEAGAFIHARMAALETMLGLPSDAAAHYEKAAAVTSGAAGEHWRYEALVLRYGMGEYEQVSRQAALLASETQDRSQASNLTALQAAAMTMLDRTGDALVLLDEYVRRRNSADTPLLWLTMADIAELAGDAERLAAARSRLAESYPEAVNAYLAAGQIRRWISPALLDREPPERSLGYIQAGSFSAREGAASLRHDLERDGFTSWIEPSGEFWRVYVNDPDGNTADRLDKAGYDYSLGR